MAESPAAAPRPGQAKAWLTRTVDDLEGARVGEARGLFVDAESGAPTWLVVKIGRLGASLVAIPMRDGAAGGRRIWVAHERQVIRSAPAVDPTRPLLREHELTICAHYGIGERVGRAAEVAGRPENSITSQPA